MHKKLGLCCMSFKCICRVVIFLMVRIYMNPSQPEIVTVKALLSSSKSRSDRAVIGAVQWHIHRHLKACCTSRENHYFMCQVRLHYKVCCSKTITIEIQFSSIQFKSILLNQRATAVMKKTLEGRILPSRLLWLIINIMNTQYNFEIFKILVALAGRRVAI